MQLLLLLLLLLLLVVTSVVATNPPKRANLPILLFQIGTKFRDEIRPRFGVARGKEFEMLDLYSFDESGERTTESYNLVSGAFREIFRSFFYIFIFLFLFLSFGVFLCCLFFLCCYF